MSKTRKIFKNKTEKMNACPKKKREHAKKPGKQYNKKGKLKTEKNGKKDNACQKKRMCRKKHECEKTKINQSKTKNKF